MLHCDAHGHVIICCGLILTYHTVLSDACMAHDAALRLELIYVILNVYMWWWRSDGQCKYAHKSLLPNLFWAFGSYSSILYSTEKRMVIIDYFDFMEGIMDIGAYRPKTNAKCARQPGESATEQSESSIFGRSAIGGILNSLISLMWC